MGRLQDSSIRDRRLVYAAVVLRSFSYGLAGVLLGIYLEVLGFNPVQAGALLTATLVGGGLLTLGASLWAERIGRRRTLIILAVLTAMGGAVFAFRPLYGILLAVALTGAISPTGKDRGAFTVVEQAILPHTSRESERNWVFARYNLAGTVSGALGALAVGTSTLLQHRAGLTQTRSLQALFLLYAVLALVVGFLYVGLSARVEPVSAGRQGNFRLTPRSKKIIGGLSGLFALDAVGGGLVVQSFLAYWFHLRFGLSTEVLGIVFFLSGVLTSLSYLAAARLAQRFGLINTMVFTHLPSNVLLMLVPVAPTVWGALAFFLAREALSQMDVPTRQSYTVAVVRPEERTAAVGFTTLTRNFAHSVSPAFGGYITQAVGMASPFLLGGLVKGVYDLALYFSFRRIKPPEEG